MKHYPRSVAILLAACIGSTGCGSSGTSSTLPDTRAVIFASLSDVVILPTYRRFVLDCQRLVEACQALRPDPTPSTLAAAQAAWRQARLSWKESEAFRFGPVQDLELRLQPKIDWTPINPDLIEQEISSAADLNADYIDTLGTSRRGLQSIEYLLFDASHDDAQSLARLRTQDSPRRLAYLLAVAEDVHRQATILTSEWDPSGGNFRGELVGSTQGTPTYAEPGAAIDALVGALVQLAADMEDKKLGKPAGIPQGTPDPERLDSWRSDNSLAELESNIEGIGNMYHGHYQQVEGEGLRVLVQAVAPSIDQSLTRQIQVTADAVHEIPPPLRTSIQTQRSAVERAYQEVRELRIALAVDLVSALGTTPHFNTDGD